MLGLLVWLIIIVAIFGIAWWALSQIPLPAPARIIVNVILALIAILVLLYFVAPMVPAPHLASP